MDPLKVDGTLEAVELVADYVETAAQHAGLDQRTTYHLCLAIDEIATNIVTHGYAAADEAGSLVVVAVLDADYLVIHLEDTGIPFDPRQAPQPDVTQPPEERRPGGLGVFLALHSVDHFSYEQVAGYNRCTFIVNRTD